MSSLQYVGPPVAANADLMYQGYIPLVKNADLSVVAIDDAINAGLAGYATIGYVNQRDTFNATEAYIDAQDALRLHLLQKGVANGVVPLDGTGRVPSQRINASLTQKWIRGPWTPPAYPGVSQTITAEQTLYSCPVTDPGYPYKLVVFGMFDSRTDRETEYPVINVRVADANAGEIIARGFGSADAPDTLAPTTGEHFTVPNPDGLDPETWNQTVLAGNNGHYQVINGQAQWVQAGVADRQWRFRRLGPDALTLTDYQKVRLVIGTDVGENPIGQPQRVKLCARMNTAETDWVGFEITHNTFTMQYCVGGVVSAVPASSGGWTTQPGPSFSTAPDTGTIYDVLAGTSVSLRQFLYFRNNVLIGGAVDGSGVTQADAGHRGWGWYAEATGRGIDQCDPPDIAELLINDTPPSFGSISIVPMPSSTVRNGSTVLYVRGARSGTTSTQTFSPYKPRLNVFAVAA